MDSIEESSQCSDTNVLLASVECVGALLGSLEALCRGEGLNQEGAEIANLRYTTLEQADYTGPLTYQSLARLPKPYRFNSWIFVFSFELFLFVVGML
jgi:brefeldin A-inhibited guanine nucleotide-exchange protein 3